MPTDLYSDLYSHLSQVSDSAERISQLICIDHTGETKGGDHLHSSIINQHINWHRGVIRLAVCMFGNLDVKH